MSGKQRGFSLIELLISMAVLLVVMGAILQLLNQSQQRSVTTSSIQEATAMLRDAVDQMVREIRLAGYPPPNSYPCPPPPGATYGACLTYQNSGYVAGGILVANPYSIQFEADTDNAGIANFFDYRLEAPIGTDVTGCPGAVVSTNPALSTPTLMRRGVRKNANGTLPAGEFQPFLENVRNCQLSNPIFVYCPAAATGLPPTCPTCPSECPSMAIYTASSLTPAARTTRIVLIRLQVQAASRDPQTGQFQNIEQFGLAERVNPDQ